MAPHSNMDSKHYIDHDTKQSLNLTSSLETAILMSKTKIEEWVEAEKAKADRAFVSYQQRLLQEQRSIDSEVADLLAVQLKLGLHVGDKPTNASFEDDNSANFVAQSLALDKAKASLQEEVLKMKREYEKREKRVKDIELEEAKQRARAAEARALKERVKEAKQTTVDDLTRGILNYKYLGLDFEKSEGENGLRFWFTQLDRDNPTRQFSFVLQVDENDRYEVVNCVPSIDAETLLEITDTLDATDDMSYLVRRMRQSFAATL